MNVYCVSAFGGEWDVNEKYYKNKSCFSTNSNYLQAADNIDKRLLGKVSEQNARAILLREREKKGQAQNQRCIYFVVMVNRIQTHIHEQAVVKNSAGVEIDRRVFPPVY